MGTPKGLTALRNKKVLIPVLSLVVFIGLVILAVHNLNAPAVGTINQTPPSKSDANDPYANPGKYSGKYINFTYPAHYRKVNTQLSGSYLEVAGFYATNQSSKQISVGVLTENIKEDSGIRLRRLQTDKYHEEPRTASGAVIFSSSANGNERTAYVPHADKVAAISLTSPPGWDLSEDLNTVLNSLEWTR